jgi:hypothetical protein
VHHLFARNTGRRYLHKGCLFPSRDLHAELT